MSSGKKNVLERVDNTASNKRIKRTSSIPVEGERHSNNLARAASTSQDVDEFELASAVALASLANAACTKVPMEVGNTSHNTTEPSNGKFEQKRTAFDPVNTHDEAEPSGRGTAVAYEQSRMAESNKRSNDDGDDDMRQNEEDREANHHLITGIFKRASGGAFAVPSSIHNMRSHGGIGHFRTASREDLSIASAPHGDDDEEPAPVTPEKRLSFPFSSSHETPAPSSADTKSSTSTPTNQLHRRVHFAPGVKKEQALGNHLHRVGGPGSHFHHPHYSYHHNRHPHSHAQMIQRLQLPSSPGSSLHGNSSIGSSPSNSPKRIIPPHHARAYLAYPTSSSSSLGNGAARVVQMEHPSLSHHSRVNSWPPPRLATSSSGSYAHPHHHPAAFMPPPARMQASSMTNTSLSPGAGSTSSGGTIMDNNNNSGPNPNAWVCDYCHAAAFATYQEACIHEETCSAHPANAAAALQSPTKSPIALHLRPGLGNASAHRPWLSPSSRGPPLVFYPPKSRTITQLRSYHAPSGAFLPLTTPHSAHDAASHPTRLAHIVPASTQWYTGSVPLGIPQKDPEWLSTLQCYIRMRCVEAFAAQIDDVTAARKSRIALHQVGVRCQFCKSQTTACREGDSASNEKAATCSASTEKTKQEQQKIMSGSFVAFPTSLSGIYEAVQRWYNDHATSCPTMPTNVKAKLQSLRDSEAQRHFSQDDDQKAPQETQRSQDSTNNDSSVDRLAGAVSSMMNILKDDSTYSISTRQYWVDSAKALGMVDTLDGIRFGKDPYTTPPNVIELEASMKFLKPRGGVNAASTYSKMSFDSSDSNSASFARRDSANDSNIDSTSGNNPGDDACSSSQQQQSQDQSQSSGDYIVYSNDTGMVPPYVYFLMRQVESCRFTEADRFVARSKGPVGYPGFQCRHCHGHAGLGKYFPVSSKSLSTNSTSQNIHAHLLKCRSCPIPIKSQLVALKEEKAKAPRLEPGWRKIFFDKIWHRLHGAPPSPQSPPNTE
ncbi:hypothetical protein ACA910_019100 [Epithemia clementina (nom. ined.)]